MLSSLASHEHNLGSTAILEPFEQLVTIGKAGALEFIYYLASSYCLVVVSKYLLKSWCP